METSKLQLLLSNITSTSKLSNQLEKLFAKKQEIIQNIELLSKQLTQNSERDNALKQQVMSLYEKLSSDIDDKDFIVNVLAKNFELKTPPKIRQVENLDSISNEIVDFVALHPEGVPMKALAEKFSDFDRVKFANHVKLLVDSNCLSKQGNRSTTKYFAS